MYMLNCSIVHLAMLVAMFIIKHPDVDKARQYDKEYKQAIMELDPETDYSDVVFDICEWEAV